MVIVALGVGCSAAQSDDDPDKDGLTNAEEEELGINANESDTDGDGLNDGYEVKGSSGFFTDPLNNDTDGDGLEDNREIRWACDPTDRDTNDDGVEDGKEVDEGLTYPYADIGKKDSDGDGLPNGAETHEIHTNPGFKSTDGDRYSDGMEYFGHQDGVDLPGFVARNPWMPSTPDIAISVDPNAKLVLAEDVTVGGETISSGEQITSSEASAAIDATLGASYETCIQAKVGYPPMGSGVTATSTATIRAEIEAKATLSTSKQSRHGTLSEWKKAKYTDLSGSKLRTTVKIKNIGNDRLESDIDELILNCYIGVDDTPFSTWILSKADDSPDITNLMPGKEATFVIEIPITFEEYSRFDSGEALTIAVNHYSFGDDQRYLENAKSICVIIDLDYGDGISYRRYIPVSSNKGITLYDAYNNFGNITLSDDGNITSIDGKEIITEKTPYKWWSIYFKNKAEGDIPANLANTKLLPGDHLLLKYEVDTDGDLLSDNYETLLGTDKDVNDTDEDGLNDGDEVDPNLDYHTDPRLFDTDGDGYDDGTEIEQRTDPNNVSDKPSGIEPSIKPTNNTVLYEDLGPESTFASDAGDNFGHSVTTGDFNNDGYDDLVVGVPGEAIGDKSDAGAFDVLYGSPGGLNASELKFWYPGLGTGSEAGDRFGYSVAAGDFNNDTFDDLAVGVPYEGAKNSGAVNVINGTQAGFETTYSNWYQSLGIGGSSEAGDLFGYSVTTGDFNNDGFDDLAVGVPREDIETNILIDRGNAGAVNVIFGSGEGLKKEGSKVWYQDQKGVGGGSEKGDQFGASVATGDFDNNGFDDLAIGAPGEAIGKKSGAGAVNVLYGSSDGLKAAHSIWYQDLRIGGSSEPHDQFGYSVAAGDFDNDGYDDLAVGVPGEAIGDKSGAGAVNVLYGSPEGLKAADSPKVKIWYQDLGIGGGSEAGDQFGYSVTTGDFNNDGYDDLAIGVPGEAIGDKSGAGAVNVLYGSSEGLKAADSTNSTKVWYQDLGIGGGSEAGDQFGYSVAAGDFNRDGKDDLAVGVPGEAIGDKSGAGAVNVLYNM